MVNHDAAQEANAIDIKIKKLSPKIGKEISPPFYATEGSAGLDLSACLEKPVKLDPGEIKKISTGIALEITSKYVVGLVFARSGLASKFGINLVNGVGVIDSDYRGELTCLIQNNGRETYTIKPGDRIAQLIFMPILFAKISFVEELSNSSRGLKGFGSTGM